MIAYRTHTPPPTIEWLSPLKSHFNFNIKVEDVQVDEFYENSTETYKSYSYNQLEILNPVTKDKILSELKDKGHDTDELIDKVNDLEID